MEKKCNLKDLRPGEIVSRITYLEVTEVSSSVNTITVRDVDNPDLRWNISGKDIIETQIDSSAQYVEVVKLPMTGLAQAFVDVPGDSVFTVEFTKQDGSSRTLTGIRVNNFQNILGRSDVIDLKLKVAGEKNYFRQVDHRNIKWFICKNKKYVLK